MPAPPEAQAGKAALAYLKGTEARPDDLMRHPAWVDAHDIRSFNKRVIRLANLLRAYLEGQEKGDWKQWHTTLRI